jgi:pimeloyl-ACP methyl ester carboxylesterase
MVHGRLIAPGPGREDPTGAVTVHVHGLGFSSYFWEFTDAPGYDYASQEARAGQASVIIDRLGYGASGKPNGDLSCIGAQADVVHQVVDDLRDGHYREDGLSGDGYQHAYKKVALAGHSAGGLIAQVEAASFGDVDALAVISWADVGASPLAVETFAGAAPVCASGGQQATPSGPGGYAYFGQTAHDYEAAMFFDADPAVVAAATARRPRDPCGDLGSIGPAIAVDLGTLAQIRVPVLLAYGDRDALFPPPAGQRQRSLYSGSRNVTLITVRDAGHAITLGRTAPTFRLAMLHWLTSLRM